MDEPKKMSYSNASRTDKNVSAVGQVVTLKAKFESEQAVKDAINAKLPEHIRILKVLRSTKNFQPKNKCDCRTYSYLMPSFCLQDHSEFIQPIKDEIKNRLRLEKITAWEVQEPLVTAKNLLPHHENIFEELKKFRSSEKTIKPLENVLARYVGTHSFHNFTSGVKKGQAEAKRVIKKCFVNRSYRPVFDGFEFVEIKIVGQSFLIHQIRKMIGLALAMVTGWAGNDHFNRAFSEGYEDVPRAPGDGLVLECIHYDGYNRWLDSLPDSDVKADKLIWTDIQPEMEKFKTDYILPTIVKESINLETGMYPWLESLKMHDYTGGKARQQLNKNMDRKLVDAREAEKLRKQREEERKKKNLKPKKGNFDNPTDQDLEDNQEDDEMVEGKESWSNLLESFLKFF